MQDMQLTQASGDTMITINDQSSVMGTTPEPMAQIAKAQPVKGKTTILARPASSQKWNYSHPQLCADQQAHIQLDPPQYMFIDQSLLQLILHA